MIPVAARNPSSSPAEPLVLLVADDLTGACDAGVAFARRGLTTRVGLNAAPCEAADVIALTTNSRHLSPSIAAEHIAEHCRSLPAARRITFRKIDSTLRGNIVSECDALLEALGLSFGVMVPALPSQGRTLKDGILRVRDISGERTLDAAELLRSQGATIASIPVCEDSCRWREAADAAVRSGARYLLCDAEFDADLRRIAAILAVYHPRPLWIGSAGLAAQAAELLAPDPPPVSSAVRWESSSAATLLCCGSDHEVTGRQIAHLSRALRTPILDAAALGADDLCSAFSTSASVILRIDLNRTDPPRLRDQLAAALNCGVGRMLLTGGETAQTVCGAASVDHLLLTGERMPGVPECLIQGGLLHGMIAATKSGGFGQEDCLTGMLTPVACTQGCAAEGGSR